MMRFLLVVLLLIAAAAGIVVFFPHLVPASLYRDRVEAAAERMLHRDVTLGGELDLRVYPQLAFGARNVTIANAPGFGEAPLAEMPEMRIVVALGPLLAGDIDIREFILIDPLIRLRQHAAGNNWTFTSPDAPRPEGSAEGFRRQPGALPVEASFGDLRIENGTIEYRGGGQERLISGLDLALDMPTLDGPARVTGQLTADGEAMTFSADLGSLRDAFEGRETALAFRLGGALLNASFDGRLLESEDFAYEGSFSTRVASIERLGRFAGADLPAGLPLQRFDADGRLSGAPDRISLAANTLRLDDIRGSGRLDADLSADKTALTGHLDIVELDLSPFLPEEAQDPAARSGLAPWSEAPIDLSFLDVLNTDLTLTAATLRYRDIVVSDASLRAAIDNNRLTATLSRFDLYGGQGSARLVANNRRAEPSYSLTANLSGLDARPFLNAAADFDRLAGTGEFVLDITATGGSQAAVMRSVAGNGRFAFADGALIGINIAQTIRNVGGLLGQNTAPTSTQDSEQASVGEEETTDFTALSGTFTASNGQVSNSDLTMLSPLLRVAGQGVLNLPEQTLEYRLQPRAVASLEGQGGTRDMRGIVVPIRVRGSFDRLRYSVDTQAVGEALVRGALQNAMGGGDGPASAEDAVRDTLLNALGLGQPATDEEETPPDTATERETVDDTAQRLLRDLLNRRPPPAEDTTEEPSTADEG